MTDSPLSSKVLVYWQCNQCKVMWVNDDMPQVCSCGNNMFVNSTKRKILFNFDVVGAVRELQSLTIYGADKVITGCARCGKKINVVFHFVEGASPVCFGCVVERVFGKGMVQNNDN